MIRVFLAIVVLAVAVPASAQQVERQTFGEWTARCDVDKMTDAKKCLVFSSLLAFGFTNGRLEIAVVGRRHYPGSQVMLRFDSDPPLSSKEPGFTGREAASILEHIGRAQRVLIRYREWPDKFVEKEFSTTGFTDAVTYVRSVSAGQPAAPKARNEVYL